MAQDKTVSELVLAWADHVKGKDSFESAELAQFLKEEEGTTARILDVYRVGGWFRALEEDGGLMVAIATPEPPLLREARNFAAMLERLGPGG